MGIPRLKLTRQPSITLAMIEPVKRATDIEEPTNRWIIHPLSTALVPWFARLGITPNMVSLSGMVCGIIGGLLYRHYANSTALVCAGFALMLCWHVLDGADGQLARLTGRQSEFGKIIDGLCDYAVFATVYIGLGLKLMPQYGGIVWLLVIVAALCHAAQAGAYETQRQMFDYFALSKPSAAIAMPTHSLTGIAEMISRIYNWIQIRFSGFDPEVYATLERAMHQQSDAAQHIRTDYRCYFAPVVHCWSILCANYRTYGIFLCCLIRRPVFYFVFEAVVLTLVHIIFVHKQKNWNQTFLEQSVKHQA